MKRERARALVTTGHRMLETIGDQFWQLSERGKSWELWGTEENLLRRFCRIPRRRVLWVIPFGAVEGK